MEITLDEARTDVIELDGERYAVLYEENSIPGTVDARVVEYSERFFLNGDNSSLGTTEVLEKEVAENPEDAIEYLENEYSPEAGDEAFEDLISF